MATLTVSGNTPTGIAVPISRAKQKFRFSGGLFLLRHLLTS